MSSDIVVQSQAVMIIMILMVFAAITLVSNAAGVLWGLVTELLHGLWASLKALVLLLIMLGLLIYVFAHSPV